MHDHSSSLPNSDWQQFLADLTKEHERHDVVVELLDQQFGDEVEVQGLPLSSIEYDPNDDVVVVAVSGRDGRHPIVLRHLVEHPQRILADSHWPGATVALDIVDAEGNHTVVTLHDPSPQD